MGRFLACIAYQGAFVIASLSWILKKATTKKRWNKMSFILMEEEKIWLTDKLDTAYSQCIASQLGQLCWSPLLVISSRRDSNCHSWYKTKDLAYFQLMLHILRSDHWFVQLLNREKEIKCEFLSKKFQKLIFLLRISRRWVAWFWQRTFLASISK